MISSTTEIANVPQKMRADVDKIMASSNVDSLVRQLKEAIQITVEHVILVAAIVRRLEELGAEIDVQVPALPYIRKIAYGQMLPELFVTLQGDDFLLERAAALPIPDQKLVAENKPLRVMETGGDFRKVPPLSMTRRELQQVFDRGRIRDDASQVGWMREQASRVRSAESDEDRAEIKLDRKRGGIVVGSIFISAAEMAHYLAALGKRGR